ncbi:MAG: hypothetical protein B6D68_02570 [spirochete symbiont of Stewartia floridana]|nr:MAG: hypothetical protein B6D68_02570 [spirochete symbiont of Stewartia floridana]
MNIFSLGFTLKELNDYFRNAYGKSEYHAKKLFCHIHTVGGTALHRLPEFGTAGKLAAQIADTFTVDLPPMNLCLAQEGLRKFVLTMGDGLRTESVLIPMAGSSTLCVSSQIGCARNCVFCETGRLGLKRDLKTAEIVAQWAAARFKLKASPRNIVFMGMGEPFDNFNEVIRAVRILSDSRGAAIPKRRISVSTAGHVDGIRALTRLEHQFPQEAWRTLRLSVSVNALNDGLRSRLMPINRVWPLGELKAALLESPQAVRKDGIYFEYVLIPKINDSPGHAEKLIAWMEGLQGKVNLIPCHPAGKRNFGEPSQESVNRFFEIIRASGRECRIRRSRGRGIGAACGMLGRTCEVLMPFRE